MSKEEMNYYKTRIGRMERFAGKLQDEISCKLYDARFEYFFEKNEERLLSTIASVAESYRDSFVSGRLRNYYEKHPENKELPFVVFGIENKGKCTISALKLLRKDILAVVENYNIGGTVMGYKIEVPDVIHEMDAVIFVALPSYLQIAAYHQLISLGIREDRILMTPEGELYLDFGYQYFDVPEFTPDPAGDIFVDAGCFNGGTSINAMKWSGGRLQKVYAFEPDAENIKSCDTTLRSMGCPYELYQKATWDKKDLLHFNIQENARYGSKISNEGNVLVEADSIDNILAGEKCTFIKLDVEGSELKTLQGAIQTIKKWKPKMAISIYHKPEDIIEIPDFLESLDMDYSYIIRQYQSRKCETTLYAF